MDVETDGDKVIDVRIYGGCGGQQNALPRLVRGRTIDDVVQRLRGTPCRNGTSCADQLARILEQEKKTFERDKNIVVVEPSAVDTSASDTDSACDDR